MPVSQTQVVETLGYGFLNASVRDCVLFKEPFAVLFPSFVVVVGSWRADMSVSILKAWVVFGHIVVMA